MKHTLRILAVMCLYFVFAGIPVAEAKRITIVAGTEMIADVARDLTGGEAEILSLVPASSCPGHHDVRAADIAFIKRADAIILHAWQQKQKHIADAVAAAAPKAAPKFMQPSGSWLDPVAQMHGSREVFEALSQMPETNAAALSKQFSARLIRIAKMADAGQKKFRPYKDTPVMASIMQADFASSLGMKIVARYGRAEDMPPADLVALVKQGKEANVAIVIDNLQSGAEAGLPLSGELGAAHVVFSNFPLFIAEVPTFEALYAYNSNLLLNALEQNAKK